MKYASYDNLKRAGNIIIDIAEGLVENVHKPVFMKEWNGDVIILDFDVIGEEDESYTEITAEDGTKSHCYYSVW